MGNCCSGERTEDKEARLPKVIKSMQVLTMGNEPTPQDFGNSVNDSYLGTAPLVVALVKKYGLYKFNESAADLRGTENNPVKKGQGPDGKFEGQFLGSKLFGKGHHVNAKGDLYVGPFVDNYHQGTGAIYYANGDYFFGKLIKGDLDLGKMIYANGQVYCGEFVNGKRSGKGTMVYKDGSKYEGYWADDLEHGYGKMINEGIWEKGKKTVARKATTENLFTSNLIQPSPAHGFRPQKPEIGDVVEKTPPTPVHATKDSSPDVMNSMAAKNKIIPVGDSQVSFNGNKTETTEIAAKDSPSKQFAKL